MVAQLKKISPNGVELWGETADVVTNVNTLAITSGGVPPAILEITSSVSTIEGTASIQVIVSVVPAVLKLDNPSVVAIGHETIVHTALAVIEISSLGTAGFRIATVPAEIEISSLGKYGYLYTMPPAVLEMNGPSIAVVGHETIIHTVPAALGLPFPGAFGFVAWAPDEVYGVSVNAPPAVIHLPFTVAMPLIGTVYEVSLSDGLITWDDVETELVLRLIETMGLADSIKFELVLLLIDYIRSVDALSGQQTGTISVSDTVHTYDSSVAWLKIISATITEALAIVDTPTAILVALLTDYMTARDAVSHNLAGTKILSETITATDTVVAEWLLSIAESIASVDSISFGRVESLTEYLAIRGTLIGNQVYSAVISEAIVITDNAVAEWVLSIAESIAAADTIAFGRVAALTEYLTIRETLTGPGVFTRTISDAVAAADNAVIELVLGLIESLSIADVLAIGKIAAERLSERITVSDLLTELGVFGVTVQDTVGVSDSVQAIISLLISEGLVATDSTTYIKDIYLSLAETLGATDALVASLNIYLSLTDNLVAIDTASNTGVFGVTITEGLKIDVSVEIDDEIFECYVLSTPKFLPSVYSGFNFNSYCEYQGRAFGANATGIFELTGDTDNGTTIHTGVTLHETDFGTRNEKRFRKAYLGVSGTEPVMIMETGEGERTVYSIDDKGKVNASRSLHSRDWVLSVSDFDSLDSIQLVPVILARGK